MRSPWRLPLALASGALALACLVFLSLTRPASPALWVPALFFGLLALFTNAFVAHNRGSLSPLMPMLVLATYLVVGLLPAAWVAFVSAWLHFWLSDAIHWAGDAAWLVSEERRASWRRPQIPSLRNSKLLTLAAANASLHTFSLLVAGSLYRLLGGELPLSLLAWRSLVQLLALGGSYLAVDYFLSGLFVAARGRRPLDHYLRALPGIAALEGLPLVFSPLIALIYLRLGLGLSLVLALAAMAAAWLTRNLSLARQRLERRVRELNGLQAVGRTLSASLDLDAILESVYRQVAQLMPAENFFVALYDVEHDEVSFPLAVQAGERQFWPPRRSGKNLTEHILRTGSPLLSRQSTTITRRRLGLDPTHNPAASWLGVPIVAGGEPLGVITVQSFSETEKFDSGHQEVLETIAAQAAVAIQNARLYAHTDQALARRVQQLDSILRATQEGVLLLDSNHKVLAANGALVDFLGITQAELQDVYAYQSLEPGGRSLLDQLEYSWDVLRGDCQALTDEVGGFRKRVVTLPGPPQRHLEHTLTAVRNQEGGVDGWLLVFRDLTDEIELARLQEDMLHMVVHDIRSPLAVLRGGLGVLRTSLGEGDLEQNLSMLDLAQRGSERIMRLVNQLLDVNRLEKGPIALKLEPLDLHTPLREIYEEFQPVVSMDHIGLVLSLPDELPQVRADAQHVTRIFYNLVDNAVKFTPDGGQIELRAYAEPPGAPGWVTVRVSDSGGGIPEEALPRLFQKYEQVSGANGRRSGTGLGLYYCKLATEAQGGQIWAESGDYSGESPGGEAGGSRFYVRLPIASQGG